MNVQSHAEVKKKRDYWTEACIAQNHSFVKMSTQALLQRSARASRGKRLSKLLEDELEADEEFWNQKAFQEEAEDNEYEAEPEEADVFDSDFDEDEPEEDEGDEYEGDRRPEKKKRKLFAGKPDKKKADKKKKSITKKSVSSLVEIAASVADGGGAQYASTKPPLPPKPVAVASESNVDSEAAQGVRKSSRMAVVVKQAEREAQQAALQALAKPVIKKKKEEDRKLTQEDMLLEAAQTEIQNLQTLQIMLAREEEVKRRAVVHKETYDGPLIRFHSKEGVNTLVFTQVEEFPDILSSPSLAYPKKILCVITGQPAKYRDPKTGQPYATKEAFKLIRERFGKGENTGRKRPDEPHQRKRTKVERERPGPGGRANVAKLKFKKVITTTDASALPQLSGVVPGQAVSNVEVEVLPPAVQPSPDPPSDVVPVDLAFTPVPVSNKNEVCSLPLDQNSMGRELPALDMPEPISEANEADFLLDDLGVCLPSNLDSSLSLPTASDISPMLLDTSTGNGETGDTSLGREMIGISSGQDQTLLSMDIMPFSDHLYDPSTHQGKIS
ncbi:hypothetical protein R1flu_021463 [Riccia fluitans]|uniref:Vps72/YL1 C-terminal domain-containing protein n=1 Tax=Riccia fluitans TaxID=41844 RepID=A0ABD1ZPS2_9MARC